MDIYTFYNKYILKKNIAFSTDSFWSFYYAGKFYKKKKEETFV